MPLAYQSAARSHPGRRRPVNEDRVLARPDARLWAVADGVGGLRRGDVAASHLIDAMAVADLTGPGLKRLDAVLETVERVNRKLAPDDAGGAQGRSTLVALLTHERQYAVLWAGDSRCYLLRAGILTGITRDHTIAQQLSDDGELLDEGRKTHPGSHVLTRAVGAAGRLELERRFAPILDNDVFLLCSDGLTACLDEAEIAAALNGGSVDDMADTLVDLALARGAPDNVSVVVVRRRSETF